MRFDGTSILPLPPSDIKQIAGRAGRYRTSSNDQKSSLENASIDTERRPSSAPPVNLGLVTTLDKVDLKVVQSAMESTPPPIKTAGLLAPDHLIIRFAEYFPPETPFSYILLRLHEISRMHTRFHICNLREQVLTADIIQEVKELSIAERLAFCAAPANARDLSTTRALLAFAKCVAKQSGGGLLDISELNLDVLDENRDLGPVYLRELEGLHRSLVLYLWLSYRFSGIFTSQALAFHTKSLVEEKIDEALAKFSYDDQARQKRRRLQENHMLQQLQEQMDLLKEHHDSGPTLVQSPDLKETVSSDESRL